MQRHHTGAPLDTMATAAMAYRDARPAPVPAARPQHRPRAPLPLHHAINFRARDTVTHRALLWSQTNVITSIKIPPCGGIYVP